MNVAPQTLRQSTAVRGFHPLTVGAGIRAAATRAPGKIALRHGARNLTYAAFVQRMERAARATVGLGLKRGDHAAIVARNCIEYLEITCGVPDAGVAVATINPRVTTAEIELICDDAEARVVFTDAATAPILRAAKFRTVKRIIEFGPEYEAWLASGQGTSALPDIDETDVWTIPYTSGTTGKPKGVLLSHRGRVLTFFGSAVEFGCFSVDDYFLALTPLNHGGGLAFPVASLFFGAAVELMDRFDPEQVLRRLKQGGITGVFMVPTHFHGLFSLDPGVLDAYRGAPIKTIISNAAPLPQALKEKAVAYFGDGILHETYGSTEGGIITNIRPPDQLRKERCVGTPFPFTEVRILDAAGKECAPEVVGELFSRSPYFFNGYWNKPKETEEAFRDGWVSVGDMAKRDDEGYIYIVDRKKDMVISGGVNIYPREIEELLFGHPAVADVAVVGLPDEKWGERLKAFIVLRSGATVSADEIFTFCTGKIAAYKIPKEIGVLDVLPRNANGKVLKTELRKLG